MEKKFTSSNFETEVLKTDKLVLVDFYGDNCGPCRMMAPVVEALAEEYADRAIIGKLDTASNMDIALKYSVMSIPTFIVFKDGQPVATTIGSMPKDSLKKLIDDNL